MQGLRREIKPWSVGIILFLVACPPNAGNSICMAKRRKKPAGAAKKQVKRPRPQTASIDCESGEVPQDFVDRVRELERVLQCEVWVFAHPTAQVSRRMMSRIDFALFGAFVRHKQELPKPKLVNGKSVSQAALLIHSPGGIAEPAYRIARLLQRQCGGFTAIVPAYAKSAATLLSLGANQIILGEDAELGPLDVQLPDFDTEEDMVSALDEIQAVEALEQSAIDSAWRMLLYLHDRTQKKLNTLLPHALHFAAEVTKPLFEKIDAVRYSRQSRRLQEAQDYAERLLRRRLPAESAKAVARDLVRNYPTHGFAIDREEAPQIGKMEGRLPVGLPVPPLKAEIKGILDWMWDEIENIKAVGKIVPAIRKRK